MKTFDVRVEQTVRVTIDETKLNDAFMAEFRASFYPFETLEEHAKHIAQLYARNMLSHRFTEGYGPLADLGISADTPRGMIEVEASS